jgi:iron(III) transport system substrate-binding protein
MVVLPQEDGLMIRFVIIPVLLCLAAMVAGCNQPSQRVVVLYSAQDQVFAEPILAQFTRETGIRVKAVFDSEAVKTVGLANRLLNERSNPQCDVWWSNEELRTRQLEAKGIFRQSNAVAFFGSRSRRIVINTNKVSIDAAPRTLSAFTNAEWRGKAALAYPMFGTTSTHFIALRQLWGAVAWENWCRALASNEPFLVEGNSVVVKLVGRGEASIGLTDSDDITAGQREGLPIAALPVNPELLVIPNTAAIIRGAPNSDEAESLFNFLQSAAVARALESSGAIESAEFPPHGLRVTDWQPIVRDIETSTARMKEIFLR